MPGRGRLVGLAKLGTGRDGVFFRVELAPFWAVTAFHGDRGAGDAYRRGRVSERMEGGRWRV